MNQLKGTVYLRDNAWYESENVIKMGVSKYAQNRNGAYITGEIERGKYICIIEIPLCKMKSIDDMLKIYFKKYHIYKGGGTEFYNREVINLIESFFIINKIDYKRLSCEELNQINRSERLKNIKVNPVKNMHKCLCGLSYKYIQGLYKHRKNCETYNNAENINDNSISCPCGKSYSHRQSLYKHRRNCDVYNENKCNDNNVFDTPNIEEREKYIEQLHEEREKYIKQTHEERETHFKHLLDVKEKHFEQMLNEKNKQIEILQTLLQPAQYQMAELSQTEETIKKKVFCIDDYLATRKPVSINEFINNFEPTQTDIDNIIYMDLMDVIVNQFMKYLKKYSKNEYPIVVSNVQYARLRIYVYSDKWTKYDRYDAQKMFESILKSFHNKLCKYIEDNWKELSSDNSKLAKYMIYVYRKPSKICKRLIPEFGIYHDEDQQSS